MANDRQVAALLRQVATQDAIELRHHMGRIGTLAVQVHLLEQYGFQYGEASRQGPRRQTVVVRMYRDPSPEARAREAATLAAFPQAGNGGAVPTLKPGTMTPRPGEERAVAHAKDRIAYDVLARAANGAQPAVAWAGLVLLVLVLLIDGKWLAALIGGGLLAAFLTVAFRINDLRRGRITQRLKAAGFIVVQDEQGRQRFLRPLAG
ncbi:hypothetical protein [Streptomyces vilmorinianum]|uniref:hypothetical protein n=1 Tax=Streptomyces vilmorinianum TaxID=3051092 RepID=UPI0010FBAC7B|nr:hypothetical protein [Streptomyces vilmorinianum]